MVEPTPFPYSLRALPPGGEPPDNDDMDTRVAKLERIADKTGERLASIDTRLTVLETRAATFATKEDLARVEGSLLAKIAESKNSVIMWVVSAILLAQLLPALLKKFGL